MVSRTLKIQKQNRQGLRVNTISDLKKKFENGLSVETLISQTLEKVKTNSHNAFINAREERALESARAIDLAKSQGKDVGFLAGIPIAIKDNICVAGSKATAGSKILENFVSPYNATVTERLEAQGAIIVGKLNMDEFAMGSTSETSFFGNTLNPQDLDRVPGGSSGGSAAVVAADVVPVALGSDTGGSIRQPAACCGVVGLKPTYGRVSRYGLIAYASSLDQIGPLAHTVEDAALVMNAIAGFDSRDCTSAHVQVPDFRALLEQDIKGKKIGIPKEYFGEGLADDQRQVIQKTLDALRSNGAELVDVSLPSLEYAIATYYVLATAEASSNLSRFDGVRYTHRSKEATNLEEMYNKSRSEGFGTEVKKRILMGSYVLSSGFYDAYYMQAQKVRRLIVDDFKKAFVSCDVLAAPTLPSSPMKLGEGYKDPMAVYLSDIYTVSLNLAGLPGISVPCGIDSLGLKSGLQIFGKSFAEAEVLQVARAIERL
jgi:aspartyl-tRNA(Asn)/glutamyl-tRNA(Gln) amidotransferase subunit A